MFNPYYSNYPMTQPYNPQYPKPQTIQGMYVDNVDIVKNTPADMSCNPVVFPKSDMSEIYVKQLMPTGESRITTFKPEVTEEKPDMITEINNRLEVVQHEISHAYYAMEGLPSMISEEDLAIFSGRFADDISETAEYIMEDCDCEY